MYTPECFNGYTMEQLEEQLRKVHQTQQMSLLSTVPIFAKHSQQTSGLLPVDLAIIITSMEQHSSDGLTQKINKKHTETSDKQADFRASNSRRARPEKAFSNEPTGRYIDILYMVTEKQSSKVSM